MVSWLQADRGGGERQADGGAVNGPHLVALVRAGAKFEKGVMVEHPNQQDQEAAARSAGNRSPGLDYFSSHVGRAVLAARGESLFRGCCSEYTAPHLLEVSL